MMQATYIHIGEIAAGNIAQQRASDSAIKHYGDMMIADHTDAQHRLDRIADAVDYLLPKDTDQEHKDMAALLATLSGRAFDSTYICKMVEGHDKAIVLYEDEGRNGSHSALREYAALTVATIRQHRAKADSMARALFP